jgi:ankyrin repeat protein
MLKSVRLQLLVTFVAALTAATFLVARGLPPEDGICEAADIDDAEGVGRCVAWGVDVNTIGLGHETALHSMAWGDHLDMAAKLIARGAQVDAQNDAGMTPLDYAHSAKMAALLIAHGADVNATSWRGDTPLLMAAGGGSREQVALLLANGAEMSAKDKWDTTLLHAAAVSGNEGVAELLIATGANVNAKDVYSQTPLHLAAANGNAEVVALLIAKGADVKAKDNKGRTALKIVLEPTKYIEPPDPAKLEAVAELLRQHGARE